MLTFAELADRAPTLTAPITERFVAARLGLLGTIRADGSPRVSPIEVGLFEGGLFVGMMPHSHKRRDVARDPRVCLLTPVADHTDVGGEGKLFGVLEQVTDAARAERILRHHAADGDFDPETIVGSPMFELLITAAAWQRVDGEVWTTTSWNPTDGLRERRLADPMAEMTDV
ncbi:pyridoxamine 5'-phosphate oxidase family protein [Desertimonas flava]|uniref:pyridoxamine 5'-phosphate oxidase family protein n=1 Tax=Desertimonas flava TaxID=2064846 RepID=UPI0013C3EFB8|nr:pyridoxamine 5'-phosphate oxidase family protein [Desertimonas flava]